MIDNQPSRADELVPVQGYRVIQGGRPEIVATVEVPARARGTYRIEGAILSYRQGLRRFRTELGPEFRLDVTPTGRRTFEEWVPLVEFPQLGRMFWSCQGQRERARRFSTLYLARTATQQVRYTLSSGLTKARTLQPGQRLFTPTRRVASTHWRVTQRTEPETVNVTVDVGFHTTSSGRCIVDVARAKAVTLPHE
jgi:hypothetical protein